MKYPDEEPDEPEPCPEPELNRIWTNAPKRASPTGLPINRSRTRDEPFVVAYLEHLADISAMRQRMGNE